MNGAYHYAKAEELLARAELMVNQPATRINPYNAMANLAVLHNSALVHSNLAQVAATVSTTPGHIDEKWLPVLTGDVAELAQLKVDLNAALSTIARVSEQLDRALGGQPEGQYRNPPGIVAQATLVADVVEGLRERVTELQGLL